VIKENEMVYIIDLSKNGTFVNGSKIGRNQKLIIHNNDEIAVGQPNVKVYMFNCNINYDNAPPEVRRKYFISKVLGQGAFGEVRLALDKVCCGYFKYVVSKNVNFSVLSNSMR
jgi:serine/threonine-protein kinase Chk2